MSSPPVPKGFEILNDAIDFKGAELMNTVVGARELLEKPGATRVRTSTDSQLLVFVPLQNKCALHSILVHTPEDLNEGAKEDDSQEEVQRPARAKVWSNLVTPLSFDDATSDSAPSETRVGERSATGWHEIPIKFVKFQNVSSILVLLDGEEDEDDVPVVLDRLVFVGRKGSARLAGSLKQNMEDMD